MGGALPISFTEGGLQPKNAVDFQTNAVTGRGEDHTPSSTSHVALLK